MLTLLKNLEDGVVRTYAVFQLHCTTETYLAKFTNSKTLLLEAVVVQVNLYQQDFFRNWSP